MCPLDVPSPVICKPGIMISALLPSESCGVAERVVRELREL